jgi:hypothetical protein
MLQKEITLHSSLGAFASPWSWYKIGLLDIGKTVQNGISIVNGKMIITEVLDNG